MSGIGSKPPQGGPPDELGEPSGGEVERKSEGSENQPEKPGGRLALERPNPPPTRGTIKQVTEILPPLTQSSAEELATPTGVNLLAAMVQERTSEARSRAVENSILNDENKRLSVENARLDERLSVYTKFKFLPTICTSIGGFLLSVAFNLREKEPLAALILAILGLVVLSVGFLLQSAFAPSIKSKDGEGRSSGEEQR